MPDREPKSEAWLDRHLAKTCHVPPRFRSFLLLGLRRLNALPRSDRFWNLTNLEPTVHKLTEFAALMIQKNPQDDEARWILAASRIEGGAAPLPADLLPALERHPAHVEWLLEGCEFAFHNRGGRDVIEDARPLLEPFLPTMKDPLLSRARKFLAGEISPP